MGLDRHFVSEADQFLKAFDEKHPEQTDRQAAEVAKHENIAKKRDQAVETTGDAVWEGF